MNKNADSNTTLRLLLGSTILAGTLAVVPVSFHLADLTIDPGAAFASDSDDRDDDDDDRSGRSSGYGSRSSDDDHDRRSRSSRRRGGNHRGSDSDKRKPGEFGYVVKVEVRGKNIEIGYSDGWEEEVENGRYELKNTANRTVVERPATQADINRLNAGARRSRL